MTATAWLALGAAALLIPLSPATSLRTAHLAGVGRLRRGASVDSRSRVDWSVAGRGAVAFAVAATSIAVAVLAGPVLAVAAGAITAYVVVAARDAGRHRAVERASRDLRSSVHVLIAELEAGAGPPAALTAAAAAGERFASDFGAAAELASQGRDAGQRLCQAHEPVLRLIGLSWRLADSTGAPLTALLGRVGADLAARDEQRRTVSVALAGPRSSAVVLSALPLLGIGLGASMGAHPLLYLLGARDGRFLCAAGVLLDVAGLMWMRSILRRAERP